MQKVIPIGDGSVGNVTVGVSQGVASLQVSLTAAAGGGKLAGVAKAQATIEVDISAKQLIDVALAAAQAEFPGAASLIAAAQAGIDAELAKS